MVLVSLLTTFLWLGCEGSSGSESSSKDITGFSFTAAANNGLSVDVTGTINGTSTILDVPSEAVFKSLVADFTTTGISVKIGDTVQVSGQTANEFSGVVTYVVIAEDGTTKSYEVNVDPIKLYLFLESNTVRNGNLGGRSGADALCMASTNKPNGVEFTYALLSVNSNDTIAGMPANKAFPDDIPIYASDGTSKIVNNWADFLDNSIPNSLYYFGIFPASETSWWSGSNADGTVNDDNCNGWTSSSSSIDGVEGVANQSSNGFFISDVHRPCDSAEMEYLLCVGY